ncbi:MAG: HAMP domain-containing sensor histidine kinase [Acidobacteriota bacterium]
MSNPGDPSAGGSGAQHPSSPERTGGGWRRRIIDAAPWWAGGGLLALLVVLGWLQYRWLDQVSEADRQRTGATLEASAERVAKDFNGELEELLRAVQPDWRRLGHRRRPADIAESPVALLAESFRTWRSGTDYPDLVAGLWLLVFEPTHDGTVPRLIRVDPDRGDWRPAEWPPEMASLRAYAEGVSGAPRGETGPPEPFELLASEIPALVLPIPSHALFETLAGPVGDRGPAPDRRGRRGGERSVSRTPDGVAEERAARRRSRLDERLRFRTLYVVQLDRGVLLEGVLGPAVEEHLSSLEGLDLSIRVAEADRPGVVLTAGAPLGSGAEGRADVSVPLYGPLRLGPGRFGPGRFGPPRGARGGLGDRFAGALAALGGFDRGRWLLEVTHAAGSLEAAVARARRRNLALGLGILGVLGVSVLSLAASAARTRSLARQQLDFVAGVTHELATPLAALRSAGQNLADGVVTEPDQVARYGRLIDREGRRLSDMVGQVLAYAGLAGRSPSFARVPVDPATAVASILEDRRDLLTAEGIEVEVDVPADLPPVDADPQALARALGNLVTNAVKYGQRRDGPGWIGVRARRDGPAVVFAVRDRGPGVDRRDLPRLFEPFYRGRGMAASAVPGSGLGLALVRGMVEAHGGSVTARSTPSGAAFELRWPTTPGGKG